MVGERFYIQHINSVGGWVFVRNPSRGAVWFTQFPFAQTRMEQEAQRRIGVAHRVVRSRDYGQTVEPVGLPSFSVALPKRLFGCGYDS